MKHLRLPVDYLDLFSHRLLDKLEEETVQYYLDDDEIMERLMQIQSLNQICLN